MSACVANTLLSATLLFRLFAMHANHALVNGDSGAYSILSSRTIVGVEPGEKRKKPGGRSLPDFTVRIARIAHLLIGNEIVVFENNL